MLALATVACDSIAPDEGSVWGSDAADLTISQGKATVLIAAGSCYGSFGEIDQAVPSGSFSLSGTYTQLMGAYPGKIQYDAQFVGSIAGNHMTLTINVPSAQRVVGPFNLTEGVSNTLPMCLYP